MEGTFVGDYAQKAVGHGMKSETDLLKNMKRGAGTAADDIGKMFKAAIAPFGCPFTAEVFCGADLEEGSR